MKKAAIVILAAALMLPIVSGCRHKDEKAGYPGHQAETQEQPQPAPQQPDSVVTQNEIPPGPPPKKSAAGRLALRNAGPAGELAAAFCHASIKADAAARTDMFSDEFLAYAGLGEEIASKLQPGELQAMFRTSHKAMLKDLSIPRKTPVRECEILLAETIKCDDAVTDIMNRAAADDLSKDRLQYALQMTNTQECGAFEIREISNSGVEYSRFITGSENGIWKILIAVRPD